MDKGAGIDNRLIISSLRALITDVKTADYHCWVDKLWNIEF